MRCGSAGFARGRLPPGGRRLRPDFPVLWVLVTGLGVMAALGATRAGLWRAYALSKAAASAGFIAAALASGATGAGWSRLALGALVLSAAGDVVLAIRREGAFLAGLILFAAAHGVYTVAFLLRGTGGGNLLLSALAVAVVAGWGWLSLHRRVPGSMRAPVAAYLSILSAMLAAGTAAGFAHRAWLLAVGAVLVAGSDLAVGRQRFGGAGFANKLIGLPAYYAGQTLIALSLGGA